MYTIKIRTVLVWLVHTLIQKTNYSLLMALAWLYSNMNAKTFEYECKEGTFEYERKEECGTLVHSNMNAKKNVARRKGNILMYA